MRTLLFHLVAISLIVLVNVEQSKKNRLELRAHPRMQTWDMGKGCNPVGFIAEITGPETEEWYCPSIEWEKPDGTVSKEESDCAPFEKRHECRESQEGCGVKGFKLDPITGRYVDSVKDCPCTIAGYPRLWRWGVCAPAHPRGEAWVVRVRLSKNGKTLAYQNVDCWVK